MTDQTKETILITARQLFSEHGYAGTTTENIARAVGIKKPSLYYFFANKEEIYLAVLQKMMDEVIAVFKQAPAQGGVNELTQVIEDLLRIGARFGVVVIFTNDETTCCRSKNLKILREHYFKMSRVISDKLADWGVVEPGFAAEILLDSLQMYLARSHQQIRLWSVKKYASHLSGLLFRR